MINSRDINDLHPAVKRAAQELIKRLLALGYPVLITQTFRDNEYQNSLYAQGRTTPGSIVTNAKGGQSMHNYRLAFDIAKNIKGQEYADDAFFTKAGKIGEDMGLEWGGDWKSIVDTPHFQFTNGLTLTDLKSGRTVPADVKIRWELVQTVQVPQVTAAVDQALDILVKNGVVSTKDYWKNNVDKLQYLDVLIENMAKKLQTVQAVQASPVTTSVDQALDILVKNGVVSTKDYWKNNVDKLQYLDVLIENMAKKLQ